jgi:hypothetical protein
MKRTPVEERAPAGQQLDPSDPTAILDTDAIVQRARAGVKRRSF